VNDWDYQEAHLVERVLQLYYIEELSRAEVARRLGLSKAKVRRLLRQARQQGMVEIIIRVPFRHLLDLESLLKDVFDGPDFVVIPHLPDEPTAFVQTLGHAAARYLLDNLRDGDIIAISGGASVYSVVQAVEAARPYDVKVVPMAGAVQGQAITDVNFLAAQLADRLGGQAYQVYAPAFVDTRGQRQMVVSMGPIKEGLDLARPASIALTGGGTVEATRSSMVAFTALSTGDMEEIANALGGVGELLSQVYNAQGVACAPGYGERVVGLTLEELQQIPPVIGVAATARKALPICGALRGGYLDALITDETAARGVLEIIGEDSPVE
jgi:DNA-binding transcriptional regulator LsrR (DeoR family)